MIRVTANAFDPDGIGGARLWIDGVYHSLDSSAPYEFSVAGLSAGSHSLVARSVDTRGNLLDSAPVTVTVAGGGGGQTPAQGIKLPIEVLGPAGTRSAVKFTLGDL